MPKYVKTLRSHFDVPLPEAEPGPDWDTAQHRAAFKGFLTFLKGNLSGQTSLRVDRSWASQSAILQGMADVMLPDHVLREAEMPDALSSLAACFDKAADIPQAAQIGPVPLSQVYDTGIERAVREIYQRDYMMFGFRELDR